MANFTKEELAAMRAKEQMNRERALAASAKHDSDVINSMKQSIGMGAPAQQATPQPMPQQAPAQPGMKKGGKVKSSASKRADGIATKGKTRGKIC